MSHLMNEGIEKMKVTVEVGIKSYLASRDRNGS